MRKLGVFTALALSGIISSCAERMVNPAVIPKPPLPKAAPETRTSNVEARRQAERIAKDARKRSAIGSRPVSPDSSVTPEQRPTTQAQPPQEVQQPQGTPISRTPPVNAALPPPPEPSEPNFPVTAQMPLPSEPAEPTFPSAPPAIELLPPPEHAEPALPEVSSKVAMPPPPEPAEPSFPVAALTPPPEPAELLLPSQEEIIAESPISIPFPDLPAPLSLHPRFDWGEVTGSFEIPRSPLSETFEASPERQIPSLIRNPSLLPIEPP